MIYVIGHKNPDTDSICSAIAYSFFLNEKGMETKPARAGEINAETKFVLKKFGFEQPELLENADGKELILVDHNEKEQMVDGEPKIVGIFDHHKVNFRCAEPIYFHSKPVGATATIVANRFSKYNIELPKEISGLLLSAILSDTVIFKSPTTTEKDKQTASKLNEKLGLDIEEFGKEVKMAGMELDKPTEALILKDFKEYDFGNEKIGIGQIEIIGVDEFTEKRREEILEAMEKVKNEKQLACLLFAVTDILKEGSELFVLGEKEKIENIFNVKFKQNSVWMDGLMSRKKQITPLLETHFKKSEIKAK